MPLKDKIQALLAERAPPAVVRPQQSFMYLAMIHGHVCPGCFGVLPASGEGSAFMLCTTPTGKTFQHRLCDACGQLAEADAASTIEQSLHGVTVNRSEMSERIQLGVAFEGEA